MSTAAAAPPDSHQSTTPLPASTHRARRWWVIAGVVVLALVVTIAFGGAWYFSGQINHDLLDATNSPITYTLTATPLGTDAVRVTAPIGASLPDGLTSARVYAIRSVDQVWQLGAPTSAGAGWVVRPLLAGDPTLTSATKVNAYREMWLTPTDLGRPFQTVPVTSALGTFHDWFVPAANATGSTWLVMVHGKGGTKAEGLRVLSAVTPLHLPALLIGYRNDEGGPTTDPQRYTYGVQDWPDVAASVQYALAHGASNVVLVGFSYGGSLVASFMSHSDLAGHVSGIVLDSPMLDAQQTVRYGASQRSLPLIGTSIPSSLVWASMQVSRLRFGSDW
jgi:hypothetical protein